MKQYRIRKLASVVLALTLAASMTAGMACTVVAAGKDATVDGSTMVTHSCDGWYDHRIQVIPGGKHGAGEAVEIYRDPCYETMEDSVKVGEIPQVEETYTYFKIAYPFMNEKGIAVGEHTWVGRDDVYNGEGLFVIHNLAALGLQRADNARDMVKVMGALAEQYGYCDWGEELIVTDPQEIWVFEIVGPGATWAKDAGAPGAHWAARRLPDTDVFAGANRSRMGVVDFDDPENFMWSTDLTALPAAMGWWKEGEDFDFSKIFDDPGAAFGCSRREWRVFDILAHSQDLPSNYDGTMPYPFSLAPDEKVTIQDLMHIYEDHYEGTKYDMTANLAAGAYGCPVRFGAKRDQRPEEVKKYNWERAIGINGCSYSFVAQCRDWLPEQIGTCLWYGCDDPTTTCRVPVYAGTTAVPEAWATGERYGYDPTCAWWAFNFLNNWATTHWDKIYEDIDAKRDEIEGKFFDAQDDFEAKAAALYETDAAAAQKMVTDYVCENMNYVFDEWWDFAFQMVGKYYDGKIMGDGDYSTAGYPTEYLEAVGFGQTALEDAKLNAGETVEPEAPEATPAPEPTEAPAPEPEPTEAPAPAPTKAPEAPAPEAPAAESSTGMVVLAAVVAVVVGCAVGFLFGKKKYNK